MNQPRHYQHLDEQLAEICAWLESNGYTLHVDRAGNVKLRRKPRP